jgi:hypothetical protein
MELKPFSEIFYEKIDIYQDHINNTHERMFMRLMAQMFNTSNNNRYRTFKTDYPISIVFVDSKNKKKIEATNITSVEHVGKDVEGDKKADIILNCANKNIPISIKHTSSNTYAKERTWADTIANFITKKGIDNSVPLMFDITPEHKHDAVFGSDILPDGFVFKSNFDQYEEIGKHKYAIYGKIITNLADLDSTEEPMLSVSSNMSRPPEIVTKKNIGLQKEVFKFDKSTLKKLQ